MRLLLLYVMLYAGALFTHFQFQLEMETKAARFCNVGMDFEDCLKLPFKPISDSLVVLVQNHIEGQTSLSSPVRVTRLVNIYLRSHVLDSQADTRWLRRFDVMPERFAGFQREFIVLCIYTSNDCTHTYLHT